MSAIVNDRDVLLQGTANRFSPPTDRALLLSTSSTVFKVPSSGQAAPATITLTATLLGMAGVVTFTTAPVTKLTVANNVATLAFTDTGSGPVTVTASFTKDGVTYSAQQTIARVTDGTNGARGLDGVDGQRGTVDVVASGYSSWSDTAARNAIINAGYSYPVNRDRVTLSGTGYSETRFYNNGSWLTIAAWINGNMVVDGTFSASKITFGVLDGVVVRFGTGHTLSNRAFEISSSGLLLADNVVGGVLSGSNFYYSGISAVQGATYWAGDAALRGQVAGSGSGGTAVLGENFANGNSGYIAGNNSYDFYASGSGTNYGPFTGAHDGLVPNDAQVEVGDLMVDAECIAQRGYSNTLFSLELSTEPYQRGVIGPVAAIIGPLRDHAPAALIEARHPFTDEQGRTTSMEVMAGTYYDLADTHTLVAVNGVGEGRIKVCGEGGPIGPNDLLVTSSMPGVAMRQADDLVRGYTVAKARVDKGKIISFATSDEVAVIPCIYLGG